jgi:two-component system CheB/CheR fusion protein
MSDRKASNPLPGSTTSASDNSPPARLTVVGVGASAGGLEACTKFINALPDGNGMAFILVQHLDPTHESLLVELLSAHTAMSVKEAAEGMALEPDHLYVIPPGTYLSVSRGALHLSKPTPPRGRRLPFDFLLTSIAQEYGRRAVCVVLSGTGSDGSLGLVAIKEHGGLVLVQDPKEADYDGMPRSAIATGAVDLTLSIEEMPDALATYPHPLATVQRPNGGTLRELSKAATALAADAVPLTAKGDETTAGELQAFAAIIELLRTTTLHDFTQYKPGTLQRRIERRMSVAGATNLSRYLDVLRDDPEEAGRLASDLLINVTSFFRDPKVFEELEANIIPDLIRRHDGDQPLRVWVAGCSTGEETWSLAMLFIEQIAALKSSLKLQIFASDVDADAVASARIGQYAETIAADVSLARLTRFFVHDEHGYRILPELRAVVIFTVQDVLADPPFSRLDFISCRNLLIYLRREAQAHVLSLFDFALHEGGILLLGSAETPGKSEGRFEAIGKVERLYRRVGQGRPTGLHFPVGGVAHGLLPQVPVRASLAQSDLAALGQRMLLEAYAPAAVLVNSKHECLHTFGTVDSYLQIPAGSATQDVLNLARDGVRAKLRAALRKAGTNASRPSSVADSPTSRRRGVVPFSIEVRPVAGNGEASHLICFVERPERDRQAYPASAGIDPSVEELERELAAMRIELAESTRSSDASIEEQKAINEEALSVKEEYQSTNEELLTSKEELQSLNEELTALNSQLQETLERQRTTSNDMQNILYSTDVATLFLDRQMNIRFFTPKTRSLFHVIPSDVGRPLADLVSLATDTALPEDALSVLNDLEPIEREIEANGVWFMRRVLPYRTDDNGVDGVVITFIDITARKRDASALEAAKQEAERANAAKSRFLAAASHDLRQPLQTLTLLQGLLAKAVEGRAAEKLVLRQNDTLGAMSGMLDTLLDINQIEAGAVKAEIVEFSVAGILSRLRDEYSYQAQAKGLAWHVVPCTLSIRSDPRLLEQILRNLVSNAIKYTRRGKVLLGCKRRRASLSIEVWDTGVGIPRDKLGAIFEEYNQLDNAARDRGKGLGLGLSIVQRLAGLLGHKVNAHSRHGAGSAFTVEVALVEGQNTPQLPSIDKASSIDARRTGAILVVEDDPNLLDLLQLFLRGEGHHVATAPDGATALDIVATSPASTDLLLTDYNLPGDLNGLDLAARLRENREALLPAVILTGDVSADTVRKIAEQDCVPLNKPVKLDSLTRVLQNLLPPPSVRATKEAREPVKSGSPLIFIIDDDANIRAGLREVLEADGQAVEDYASSQSFLHAYRPGRGACLLIDATIPGLSALDLLRRLRGMEDQMPTIMITGRGDVHMAVEAMKAGAFDFIEKPINKAELLVSIARAFDQLANAENLSAWRATAARAVQSLTDRQRQVLALVIAGHPSKNIAADLGISQRTVENHRAAIMERTGCKSLPALARLAFMAAWTALDDPLGGPQATATNRPP